MKVQHFSVRPLVGSGMNIRQFSARFRKSDKGPYRIAIVRAGVNGRTRVEVSESPAGHSVQVHVNGVRVWPPRSPNPTNPKRKTKTMQAPPAPTSGDKVEWAELNGRLLYITVLDLKRDIETVHGKSDAVSANVVILDGDRKGDVLEDILVFPRVLRSQLSQLVGADDNVALGRLGKGDAKPGKSAPWKLLPATSEDHEVGLKYEQYVKAQNLADPGF